jgi:hypothetical protein
LKTSWDIWDCETTPEEWKTKLIVKLPKKGDWSICDNRRGITFLPLSSKVFSRIILNIIMAAIEDKIGKEHAGFRENKSCIDQIFNVRQMLEQS